MTLAQLLALDVQAMWDALPREQQRAIVVPLLLSEFAHVTADDDGTDASPQDQETAAGIEHRAFDDAMNAIEAAFPEILGDDFTALRDLSINMIDEASKLPVKGLRGRRALYNIGRGAWIKLGGKDVTIAGVKNHGTEEDPVWEVWLQHHVDAERLRRHPDQFIGPRLPAFVSVLGLVPTVEPAPLDAVDDVLRRAA